MISQSYELKSAVLLDVLRAQVVTLPIIIDPLAHIVQLRRGLRFIFCGVRVAEESAVEALIETQALARSE